MLAEDADIIDDEKPVVGWRVVFIVMCNAS
jgi:hypothetical protein